MDTQAKKDFLNSMKKPKEIEYDLDNHRIIMQLWFEGYRENLLSNAYRCSVKKILDIVHQYSGHFLITESEPIYKYYKIAKDRIERCEYVNDIKVYKMPPFISEQLSNPDSSISKMVRNGLDSIWIYNSFNEYKSYRDFRYYGIEIPMIDEKPISFEKFVRMRQLWKNDYFTNYPLTETHIPDSKQNAKSNNLAKICEVLDVEEDQLYRYLGMYGQYGPSNGGAYRISSSTVYKHWKYYKELIYNAIYVEHIDRATVFQCLGIASDTFMLELYFMVEKEIAKGKS